MAGRHSKDFRQRSDTIFILEISVKWLYEGIEGETKDQEGSACNRLGRNKIAFLFSNADDAINTQRTPGNIQNLRHLPHTPLLLNK